MCGLKGNTIFGQEDRRDKGAGRQGDSGLGDRRERGQGDRMSVQLLFGSPRCPGPWKKETVVMKYQEHFLVKRVWKMLDKH